MRTKPRAWRPKKGQWFNAYVKEFNKLHVCGPFRCISYYSSEEYSQYVEGTDAEGDIFVFKLAEFRLQPLVKTSRERRR